MKSQKVNTHHDLDVWKRSISYVTKIYELTETFPSEERFGLISQIRRSAISILSNVAEMEAKLIISNNLKFMVSSDQLLPELNEIKKMTIG